MKCKNQIYNVSKEEESIKFYKNSKSLKRSKFRFRFNIKIIIRENQIIKIKINYNLIKKIKINFKKL